MIILLLSGTGVGSATSTNLSLSLSPTLPSSNDTSSLQSENVRCHGYESSEVIVNTALLLHIEMLESKNVKSRKQVEDLASRRKAFRFEIITYFDT